MKKLFSILFVVCVLLSGMQLSVATHYCGDEVAAVKLSFTGAKATCGMEIPETTCLTHNAITSRCCHDQLAVYKVDPNYSPSVFQISEPITHLLQVFYVPVNGVFDFFHYSISTYTIVHPPGELLASDVSLPDICVFRI